MEEQMLTPINTLSRENLHVLIRNNVLNDSLEFYSNCDAMDADSPIRKPSLPPISKKLFQSPMSDSPDENQYSPKFTKRSERNKQKRKRKQSLIPDSSEKIKKVYVQECDKDSYSPDVNVGMRKRVLISLFHNKEYSMDFD